MHRVAVGDVAAPTRTSGDGGRASSRSVAELAARTRRPPRQPGKRTVLVVDDEAEIRKLLRRVLEERGYRVLEADRGLVALRMVKEHPPDVIILDAMLPEVHGFDIAKRLKGTRALRQHPDRDGLGRVPRLALRRGLKASYGVDAYIEKPFRVGRRRRRGRERARAGQAAERSDPERISAEAEKMLVAGIAAYQEGKFDEAIEHLREGTRSIRSRTGCTSTSGCSTASTGRSTTRSRSSRRRSTSTASTSPR